MMASTITFLVIQRDMTRVGLILLRVKHRCFMLVKETVERFNVGRPQHIQEKQRDNRTAFRKLKR